MSADLMLETPRSYAERLAGYIASPTKIEALTRMEFGRAPPLHVIANMRYRVERRTKPLPRYCNESAACDGEDYRPRSLVKVEKLKAVRLPPIKLPPPVFVRPGEGQKAMPESLIGAIAADFGTTLGKVLSKDRAFIPTRARQAIYTILRARQYSYPQIGRWMGRDHSTVIYGVERFDAYAAHFPQMLDVFNKYTAPELAQ